ncbi:MAG: hypothetical protein MJ185_11195 [Treponema sp.]|nr:hypothetical protein [Treponema sp.]
MEKYVLLCKVFNEQMDLFDGDRDIAAYNTLKIVGTPDLMAEYWEKHRSEIRNLMKEILL